MKKEETKKGIYKNLLTGALSSGIARTIMNPLERIEILRQTQNFDYKNLSFFQSVIKMYKTQGVKGFFKGNTASLMRVLPYSAIEFCSVEFSKNILRKFKLSTKNFLGLFLCGAFSGWAAVTATFPLDVVRTRLAIHTEHSAIKEKTITESLRNVYKEGGIRGLYKGYGLTSLGNILFIASKQAMFEFLKNNFPMKKYKNSANLIYGFAAGTFGTVLLYPNYVLKRVAQTTTDKSFTLGQYISHIYKEKGLRGFYAGLSLNLIKSGPYFGIMFFCNEKLKEIVKF